VQVWVKQNQRYRAHIHFGMFDPRRLVSDDDIEAKFVAAGFLVVKVVGEGQERWAFGTWPNQDCLSPELPDCIVKVDPI